MAEDSLIGDRAHLFGIGEIRNLLAEEPGSRLQGDSWKDGTAVYYATRISDYTRWQPPYVFEHMWVLRGLTWGTLGVEGALALLIWFRWTRPWVWVLGLAFHLGLELTMNVPFIEWAFMALYVLWWDSGTRPMGLGSSRVVS